MNFRFALILLSGVQLGWSTISLTMKDPSDMAIAGVSCAVGTGAASISDASGALVLSSSAGIIPIRQDLTNNPLLDIPVSTGEKAVLSVFDSRGHRIIQRDIRNGESFDFATSTPGVYFVRITGRNLNVSQSVAVMGGHLAFSGVYPANEAPNALRKSAAAVDVACSKTGYATKVFPLSDGDVKTIGFGAPIGRAFDRTKYPLIPDFNLEVAEDFNTADWANGLTWDGSYKSNDIVWEPSDGGFGDNAVRFKPDHIIFKDNALFMKMENIPQAKSISHSESQNCDKTAANSECPDKTTFNADTTSFVSGEIRTTNKNFRFGRYEINIDPPDNGTAVGNADGFLAAMFTWFTPRDLNWREIDIEILGNKPSSFLTNMFFGNKQPSYAPALESPVYPAPAGYDPRTAHTYAFEWLPKTVKWYVDGALVRTEGVGGTTTNAKVEISQMNTKVVMNFWKLRGGGAPIVGGVGANNKYPIEAKFDNFRYYRWDQDGDKKTYPETVCQLKTSNGCQ